MSVSTDLPFCVPSNVSSFPLFVEVLFFLLPSYSQLFALESVSEARKIMRKI